jgi:tetratricopeptide (TPR) repeat protein
MKQKKAVKKVIDPKELNILKVTLGIIIAVFAFLLYAQSISFGYTLDDTTISKENKLVTQGFHGIPKLLTTDYWYGFDNKVRGPVYRPIPLVAMAVQWHFFRDKPNMYHLLNVLLYALSCWLLYLVLCKLFKKMNLLFPFICALLFTAHPIHTEVVNSIKSLDEILCFLFGILSIFLVLLYLEKNKILLLIGAALSFMFSILSKETGIGFLIIIPLVIFLFTNMEAKKNMVFTLSLLVITGIFFLVRYKIFESIQKIGFDSPLNNSLFAAPDMLSQKATAFFILFRYIILLIFPHPLTYDYSFAQIPIQKITDPSAIISIALYLALGIFAFINILKKNIPAFAILFYLIMLVPVSNIFLLIQTTMAERFLYIPSLGFCMLLAFLLIKYTRTEAVKTNFSNINQFFFSNILVMFIVGVIVLAYTTKTIARSQDWKNNTALFTHDLVTSDKSARAHYNYGSVCYFDLFVKEKDFSKKSVYLDKAQEEFSTAIKIMPYYPDAYKNLAKCLEDRGDYTDEINTFETLFKYDKNPDTLVFCNIGILYTKTKDFDKAISYLDSAIKYNHNYAKAYKNLAFSYLNKSMYPQAIAASEAAIRIDSSYEKPYSYLGCAYMNLKDYPTALKYLNKSLQMDPSDIESVKFLSTTYYFMGDSANAMKYYNMVPK